MNPSFSPSVAFRFGCFVLAALGAAGCAVPYGKRIGESMHSGICYVHHEPMKKERLSVVYGLIGYVREWDDARFSRFPFAYRMVPGGCSRIIVLDHPELSSPEYEEDYVCARCTAAKDRWIKQHPNFKDYR